jgi:hypothetical protein
MKKLIIVLITSLFSLHSFSQYVNDGSAEIEKKMPKNVITISPLGFINKARLKVERGIGNYFSVGAIGSFYYGVFPGFQVAPFVRVYPQGEGLNGFYLYVKGIYGNHSPIYDVIDPYYQSVNRIENPFESTGIGTGLGIQVISGKNKSVAVDFSMGVKFMSPASYVFDTNYYEISGAFTNAIYYTTGPGSYFDGFVGVGISF